MITEYIVLQYGNVMTGEYLNIGVYTYSADENNQEVICRFVKKFDRVNNAFNCIDPILSELVKSWLGKINTKISLKELVDSCDTPYTSLRVTEPRGSLLKTPEELLNSIADTFLVE